MSLSEFMWAMYMPGAGQKVMLDPQELELQVAGDLDRCAGNGSWVLCKSNEHSTAEPSFQHPKSFICWFVMFCCFSLNL
jgi:hypothetical protein